MKVQSSVLKILLDVESGEAEVRFSDAWGLANTLWKMDILADLISDLSGELEVVTQEFEAEMDALRDQVSLKDRHLELVKSKGEVS